MTVVRITVEIDRANDTLVAHVVTAKGECLYSTKPVPSEKTFAEVMWPAGDWARRNGHTVVKR